MPTQPAARKALFSLLPDKVKGSVLELGSGWGTLAFPLAHKYPKNSVIAYEISYVPFYFSWFRQKIFGPSNLSLKKEDFYKESFQEAGLVVTYLFPAAMKKLATRIPKNVTVVSNTFFLPGREASQILKLQDLFNTTLFLYPGKGVENNRDFELDRREPLN